jgi:hypothetical protein
MSQEYRLELIVTRPLTLKGSQAARERCEENEIPAEIFSGPLSFLELPKEKVAKSDSETLDPMRSVFDKATLEW